MPMMAVPTCQHWMESGRRCGSPAMRRKRYCYFHQRDHERGAKKKAERARQRWFESVDMSDARAIQRALSEVLRRQLDGQVDHKTANKMVYKLQIASLGLANRFH